MNRPRFRLSMRGKVRRYRYEKIFWIVMIPVLWITGLIDSVAVVSLLSLYALVITAGGAEQAAQAALEASTEDGTGSSRAD